MSNSTSPSPPLHPDSLSSSSSLACPQKQMYQKTLAKHQGRYAAPSYHHFSPEASSLPKPLFLQSDLQRQKSVSLAFDSSKVDNDKDDLNASKAHHHQQEGINLVKNHSKPSKKGKKKNTFVPKAILKKGEQLSPSPPSSITCMEKESKANSEGANTGGRLLEILARKNSKLNPNLTSADAEKPSAPKTSSSIVVPIEEELSGKICALLGISPN